MSVLRDKRVVVTRAIHQAPALENLLREQQAVPIRYPCIAIAPPVDPHELDQQLRALESFDWLIVTSINTVYALVDRLTALDHRPDWSQLKVAVVGSKTGAVFQQQFRCQPDFVPDTFTGEALANTLPIQAGARILVPQSALADETVASILCRRGAHVVSLDAYQTVIGDGGEDVPALLEQNEVDVLTFTSSSTVTNFCQRIHPLSVPDVPALCIGPSTGVTAREVGFRQVIVPDHDYSLAGMINALIGFYEAQTP